MATVLDRRTGYGSLNGEYAGFKADVASATDYYPFGMEMSGRSLSSKNSRFGYSGMEKDDEISGSGNSYDFNARIYNSRIARWFSIDPLQKKYPSLSPYNFVANSPLMFVDRDGKQIFIAGTTSDKMFFLSEIKRLTGLDIELKNNELVLNGMGDTKDIVSQSLRDHVLNLIDTKSKNYENRIVFKLVSNNKGSFIDKSYGDKVNSSNVYYDDFYNGAFDLKDYSAAGGNDAINVTLLTHVIVERIAVKQYYGKDYVSFLEERPLLYDKKNETLIVEDDNGVFDNSHMKAIVEEAKALKEVSGNNYINNPIITQERNKTTRNYSGAKIEMTSNPENNQDIQAINIKQ